MSGTVHKKNVRVLLVRHGEREDEAENRHRKHKNLRPRSTKDKLDPSLTIEGYDQAAGAFSNLIQALSLNQNKTKEESKGKIALFSSPLRRTVGTALMVATAITDGEECKISTQLPLLASNKVGSDEGEDIPSNIPIVVMNGLCDCAAYVVKSGGAHAAVTKGLIDCAARSFNDWTENSGTSFIPALKLITKTAYQSQSGQSLRNSSNVQFWRETNNDNFSPMTAPFLPIKDESLIPSMSTNERTTNVIDEALPGEYTVVNEKNHNDFLQTVNRAVYLTVHAGLDTCVIVTHREGIRYLANNVCGLRLPHGLKTPYCCIGSFRADVKFNMPSPSSSGGGKHKMYSVKWTCHSVTPFQDFETIHLPPLTTKLSACDDDTTTDIVSSIPGGKPKHTLSTISSILSRGLPLQKLGKEFMLTEYQTSNTEKKEIKGTETDLTIFEAFFVDGRRRWLHLWTTYEFIIK